MIWLLAYLLRSKALGSGLIEETVILYNQEVFITNLTSYVYESYINYSLIESDCDTATIKGINFLELAYEYSFNFSASGNFVSMTEYTNNSVSLFLISDNYTIMLFSLDLITGEIKVEKKILLSNLTNISNSSIVDTVLINSMIFILVTSTEIIDLVNTLSNSIFTINITDSFEINEMDIWDLRHLENLKMGHSNSFLIGFSVFAYNSTGAIFVYDFNNISNPEIMECFLNFTLNPIGNTQIGNTLDLMIYSDYLVVLQEKAVIVCHKSGVYFKEFYYDDMSLYGELYSLSYLSSQIQTIIKPPSIIFSINSESGLILLDVTKQFEKALIKQYNGKTVQGYSTGSQIYEPYIFSTNFNESLILQLAYQNLDESFYSFFSNLTALINNTDKDGSWLVVQGLSNFYYIRQDYNTTRVFQFNMSLPYLTLMSDHDCYAVVEANEWGNTSLILFLVKVSKSVYDIALVNGHRFSGMNKLNFTIYFSNNTEILPINLTGIISGWELTYAFNSSMLQENFIFEYKVEEPFTRKVYSLDIAYFKGVLVDQNAYLICSNGILKYGESFTYASNPLDICFLVINGSNLIVVLFSFEIVLYDVNLTIHSSFLLDFECKFVKCQSGVIICANNTQIIYIFDNGFTSTTILTKANFIVDASYYNISNFQLEMQLLLTDQGVSSIILSENQVICNRSYTMIGSIILISTNYVYILNPGIKVYSINDLSFLIKIIPIPDFIYSGLNAGDILVIETAQSIYIIDGLLPVTSSLIFIMNNYNCSIMSSQFPYLLTLCENQFYIYDFSGSFKVNTIYTNFTVPNISAVNEGVYSPELILIIRNNNINEILLPLTFHLYTYGITLFFSPVSLTNVTTAFDYSYPYTFNLNDIMHGYNINSSLIVDGTEMVFDPFNISPKVNLYPSVYESSSYKGKEEFLDHTVARYLNNEYIIILTNFTLEIVDYTATDYPKPGNMSYYKSISLFSLFNQNLSCSDIEFITQSEEFCILSMSCINNSSYLLYYQGQLINLPLPKYYLAVISVSLSNFSTYVQLQELPYMPTWIKPITASEFSFSLIIIDKVSITRNYTYNNHMIIVQGHFEDPYDVILETQSIVNFYTLGLDSMYAVYVDGFFENYSNSGINKLKLFIADFTYGIRIVKVENGITTVVGGLPFTNNNVVSLSVCGNVLIVLTANTNIIVYTIQSSTVTVLETYPPSPIDKYIGTNSKISCSNYYHPHYISIYLYNRHLKEFRLRIIDLETNFDRTVIYEQLLSSNISIAKSLFLMNNTFTVIISQPARIYAYYINEPCLYFPELTIKEYNNVSMGKDQFEFSLALRASNSLDNFLDSPVVYITRFGPKEHLSEEIENNYQLVFVFGSILLIVVTLASIFMHKVLENRRRLFRTVNIEMEPTFS